MTDTVSDIMDQVTNKKLKARQLTDAVRLLNSALHSMANITELDDTKTEIETLKSAIEAQISTLNMDIQALKDKTVNG